MDSCDTYQDTNSDTPDSTVADVGGPYPSFNDIFPAVNEYEYRYDLPWPEDLFDDLRVTLTEPYGGVSNKNVLNPHAPATEKPDIEDHERVCLPQHGLTLLSSIAVDSNSHPSGRLPVRYSPLSTISCPERDSEYVRCESAVREIYHNSGDRFDIDWAKYEVGKIWLWTGQFPNNIYRQLGTLLLPLPPVKPFRFPHALPLEIQWMVLEMCISMPNSRLDFIRRRENSTGGSTERAACKQLRGVVPGRREPKSYVERVQKEATRRHVLRAVALLSVSRGIRQFCLNRFWGKNEISFEYPGIATKLIKTLRGTGKFVRIISFHHRHYHAQTRAFFDTAAANLAGLEKLIFQPTINVDSSLIYYETLEFAKHAVKFLNQIFIIHKGKDNEKEMTGSSLLQFSPEYAKKFPQVIRFFEEVMEHLPKATKMEARAEKGRLTRQSKKDASAALAATSARPTT